jgi:hypothetical protein
VKGSGGMKDRKRVRRNEGKKTKDGERKERKQRRDKDRHFPTPVL